MKPRVVVNYESSSSEDEFHRIGRQQSKRRKLHSKREKDIEYSSDKESDDEDRDAESSVGEGSSVEEGSRDEKQECERRLCRATETDEPDGNQESTGMANVLNTILGEKVDDEVILVKGATDKQINAKKIKANQEGSDNKPKNAQFACLEERKKWNEMNHESPNILNLPKEKFLKKIATRLMDETEMLPGLTRDADENVISEICTLVKRICRKKYNNNLLAVDGSIKLRMVDQSLLVIPVSINFLHDCTRLDCHSVASENKGEKRKRGRPPGRKNKYTDIPDTLDSHHKYGTRRGGKFQGIQWEKMAAQKGLSDDAPVDFSEDLISDAEEEEKERGETPVEITQHQIPNLLKQEDLSNTIETGEEISTLLPFEVKEKKDNVTTIEHENVVSVGVSDGVKKETGAVIRRVLKKKSLDMNIIHEIVNSQETWRCKLCFFTTNGGASLAQLHVRRNHGARHFCRHCSKMFRGPAELISHRRRCLQRVTCLQCNRKFLNDSTLKEHVLKVHSKNAEKRIKIKVSPEEEETFLKNLKQYYSPEIEGEKLKGWECKLCQFHCASSENAMKRHMKTHAKQRACSLCDRSFCYQSELLEHVRVVHKGLMYKCPKCSSTFTTKTGIRKHHLKQHRSSISVKDCQIATAEVEEDNSAVIKQLIALAEEFGAMLPPAKLNDLMEAIAFEQTTDIHGKISETKDGCKWRCKVCQYVSNRSQSFMQMHIKRMHYSMFRIKCSLCEKRFKCNAARREHVEVEHEGKRYGCKQCTSSFKSQQALQLHVRNVHATEEERLIILKSVQSKTPMVTTVKENGKSVLWRCKICQFESTLSKHKVQRHVERIHENKMFECETCHKKFTTTAACAAHTRAVHQGMGYVCEFCSKTFLSLSGLKHHLSSHTGDYRYFCSQCGRGFNDLAVYDGHMNKHYGAKLTCPRCGKKFTYASYLKAHTKKCLKGNEEAESNMVLSSSGGSISLTDSAAAQLANISLLNGSTQITLIEQPDGRHSMTLLPPEVLKGAISSEVSVEVQDAKMDIPNEGKAIENDNEILNRVDDNLDKNDLSKFNDIKDEEGDSGRLDGNLILTEKQQIMLANGERVQLTEEQQQNLGFEHHTSENMLPASSGKVEENRVIVKPNIILQLQGGQIIMINDCGDNVLGCTETSASLPTSSHLDGYVIKTDQIIQSHSPTLQESERELLNGRSKTPDHFIVDNNITEMTDIKAPDSFQLSDFKVLSSMGASMASMSAPSLSQAGAQTLILEQPDSTICVGGLSLSDDSAHTDNNSHCVVSAAMLRNGQNFVLTESSVSDLSTHKIGIEETDQNLTLVSDELINSVDGIQSIELNSENLPENIQNVAIGPNGEIIVFTVRTDSIDE